MTEENRTTNQGDKSNYFENVETINVKNAGKKIPKNLTRPPFISGVFIGREDDIRIVHDKLFNNSQLLLLVNGQGEIGKTTLAAHYYHTFQNDYQHLAWVFTGSSLLDALLTLAHPLQLEFPQELSAQKRLDGLLAKMAELEKPCLLVIDNANNLENLENNYQALHSCANFHIVLTTRITEFEQAASHKIGSLEPADAITLFQKHYPQHQADEESLLENILKAVGYNTLVMELLAKNLNLFNDRLKTRYVLADPLKDLQHKGMLALKSQAVKIAYHADGPALRKETPEAIIAAMYDLSKLNDAETALLSIFAVLPAEDIPYSLLETMLPEIENLDTLLLALAQKGWLENETTESFKVSPVVQEITRQKNQQHLHKDCLSLINKLNEKLEYEPGIGHFLNASYQEAAQYTRYAESIVQHISANTGNQAILYERLGNYYMTTGNLDKALGFFEDETDLFKELYQDYPTNVSFKNGLAISYIKLASIYEKTENQSQAKEHYLLSKELLTALAESFPEYVEFKNNLDWVVGKLAEDPQ